MFNNAHSAVSNANLGYILGGVGVAAFVGGLVWYIKTGHVETEMPAVSVAPWLTSGGGGLAITGSMR